MDDYQPREVATRESWGTSPAGPMSPFQYDARFSQQQYAEIRCGLVPEDMDDKWFIFWEDDSLYVHRSWSGHLVYRVDFEPAGDQMRAVRASVAMDGVHHSRECDEYEARLLDFVIRRWLLREPVEFRALGGPLLPAPVVLDLHEEGGASLSARQREGYWLGLFSRIRGWLRRRLTRA